MTMQLLDRFSTHLKEVLGRSIRLATELRNREVEPIHLLFAITVQKGSVAAEIINRSKINPKTLEQALINVPSTKEAAPTDSMLAQATLTPLSERAKIALEKAMLIAHEHRHNYIGTEHLLGGLIRLNDARIAHILELHGIKPKELEKQLTTVLTNATQFPELSDIAEMAEHLQDALPDNQEIGLMPPQHSHSHKRPGHKESPLDFFATNLTDPEMQNDIDPVVGREREIERVIQILCRRTKNNPVLLGDPGVGKTAIVEGLAKKIMQGDVPDMLLNKKIYALDLAMLIAGTIYRGEFEARLRQVIEEVASRPEVILFIDEVHNIVGTGSNQGTMDAGNILKPALARGQIRCIGATTPAEFKKYIENDAALERRFQSVLVKEPSVEDTITILKGIKKNYEQYHDLKITPEAIVMAVRLADRYLTSKFFPDKAIDLLDETLSAKRLSIKTPTWQGRIARLEQRLEKTTLAKERAAATDNFAEAVKLKTQEERLRKKIAAAEVKNARVHKPFGTVTERDVIDQIAKITNAVPAEIMLEEKNELLRLAEKLKAYVVGQDEIIHDLAGIIQQARLGISSPDRPLASFLFVGESGVGKTELATALAKTLYPGKNALIKLNMSEFNEGFSVSKLLGSPAGYVGYKENNQFTDQLKLNPYSIVLFDEIDKAHREVTRLLLQILENGEITDSTGKKISLRHAIVILTTSLGAAEASRGTLGFGAERQERSQIVKQLAERLKDHFSPEIINRLDTILFFNPLDPNTLEQIAALEVARLNERLRNHRTAALVPAETLRWLIKEIPGDKPSAREVRRAVKNEIETLIGGMLLEHKIKPHYTFAVHKDKLIVT